MACMSCKRFFHLSGLGDGFKVTRFCHQCLENDSGAEETSESDELFIPRKLREVVKIRGLKIVHQNIQSLSDKIDQLRLLLHGLHSSIQLITRCESWQRPIEKTVNMKFRVIRFSERTERVTAAGLLSTHGKT